MPKQDPKSADGQEHRAGLAADQTDLSLKHLQLEFARIDVLIRREVQRWRFANQDPADPYRGFYISPDEAKALSDRAFGVSWGQTVALPPEEEQLFATAWTEAENRARAFAAKAEEKGQTLRLNYLAEVFGLSRFDIDALLICLAPTLDLRYEQLYGYLQDHVARKQPRTNLVLNLLAAPGPERLNYLFHFSEEAPLRKHQILTCVSEAGSIEPPLLSQTLVADQTIVSWLWGAYHPRPNLAPHIALIRSPEEAVEVLLPDDIRQRLTGVIVNKPVIVFYGPDRGSQEAAAKFIARQLERPLLSVDLSGLINDACPPLAALKLVLRDARLTGAIPCLLGWDICLQDKSIPAALLAELCAFPEPVIVVGQIHWQSAGFDRKRPLCWQAFTVPTYKQRRALWRHYLQEENIAGPASTALDLTSLADQFQLTTDQIRDAVITARDMALQRGDDLCLTDLFAAARSRSTIRLADLAQKITPRYEWCDIILPDDQILILREAVNMIRSRSKVLEAWQIGKKLTSSRGVAMLFAGPPGTGKTMAAEVIGCELSLDLYKIDLSMIISKYIGETEKNLERIFKEAEQSNAILFFDEADALFGKRSEVRDSHDRYANIEISYLLQRMEAYDGVTILATNLRANLDEAFTRRLHFTLNFPFPDEADRLRIWQTLFPASVPRHPDLDLELVARRFKLAGGNIRNIIVGAAYLAAGDGDQVTMDHLLHSTFRELQKMGRMIDEADMKLQ